MSGTLAPFMIGTWVTAFNQRVLGEAWMGRTVLLSWEPMFIAAGAITGLRVCWSMLLGSITAWMIFVPVLTHRGVIEGAGYGTLVQWTLWPGVACMVTSSLLSFALQWRTALRAFSDLGAMFGGGRRRADDPIAAIEPPASWFIAGQLVGLVGLAWLGHRTFGMPYWQTAVAVLLSFVLALVACRVTGETDTTPVGAMGKITQLVFGVLHPRNVSVNLMSANVTAAAASSSADLLTDLKSGYLLGANPRKQFIAQFAGIFVGTLVTVLSFRLLVPDAGALGTDQFPAPAAQTWRAVAVALSDGLGALGPVKTWSIVIGGLVGIVLTLLPRVMPGARIPRPVARRPRPGVDVSLVLRRAVLPRGRPGLVGGAALSEMVGGIHLPRGLRLDRRREPHGGDDRDLGERSRAPPSPRGPLIRPRPARCRRAGRRLDQASVASLAWSCCFGTAPITWSFTTPSFTNRIVGIERTP